MSIVEQSIVREEKSHPEPISSEILDLVQSAKSERTKRAYRTDWRQFDEWCSVSGYVSLPATPETIVRFLMLRSKTHKASSLERMLCSISQAHQTAGYDPSPTSSKVVRLAMQGLRRKIGVRQTKKAAIRVEHLRSASELFPDDLMGVRDKALLLLGFAGAFRRSELVALDVSDLEFTSAGLIVHVRRSKTDQEGQGRDKEITWGSNPDTCPIRALRNWLEISSVTEGSIFRRIGRAGKCQPHRLTDQSVALIVKRRAPLLGLDPDNLGGHSLRAGFVTDAFAAGIDRVDIKQQTFHRSDKVLEGYHRVARRFESNTTARVGL